MRIWSLHPGLLDVKGLTACWRETLLARKVLRGETRGYRNHPQLIRFKASPDPLEAIEVYLVGLFNEASRRGYRYDKSKINDKACAAKIRVTKGQLAYEREHLLQKLKTRDPKRALLLEVEKEDLSHPLFEVVEGEVEQWEVQRNEK